MSLTAYIKTDTLAARFFSLIKSLGAAQCSIRYGVLPPRWSSPRDDQRREPPIGAIEKKHSSEIDDESGLLTAEHETREETGVDLTKLSKTQHICTFSLGHCIRYVVYFSENRACPTVPMA